MCERNSNHLIGFVLQTPLDNGPFCSMTIQRDTGFNYIALFLYTDPIFCPVSLLKDQMWMIRWRWSGLPIVILPIAFTYLHDTYIARRIAELHAELAAIEAALLAPHSSDLEALDFGGLTRRLHAFSTDLSDLARRSHFQNTVLSTIGETLRTLTAGGGGMHAEVHKARLAALEMAMQGRQYDLEAMPAREQTARATVCGSPCYSTAKEREC